MTTTDVQTALLQLLAICRGSLPQYMRHARPHQTSQSDEAQAALADIVADQDVMAERIAGKLEALGTVPKSVEFPMEFTGLHDMSIDYLIDRAIRRQNEDIAALDRLSNSLACHQSVRSLADEASGMAVAHLEALQECLAAE